MTSSLRNALLCSVCIDLIVLDQITKWYFSWADMVTVIPGWMYLRYMENPGIAFSLPLHGWMLQVVTITLICAIIGYVIYKRMWQNTLHFVFILFLLAGAIGNAIDRLWHNYVIDFISIGTFPVFNFADVYVNVGVWGLLIVMLLQKNKKV